MTDLFSYDDLGVLTESFGRVPDDDLLARLLSTARDLAGQRYSAALRIWPETLAAYQGQLAAYDRRMSNWLAAKEMSDRMARTYEAEHARWSARPDRGDVASPTPPLDPGPAPEMPEAPIEPAAPTDADAVAMLMAEQRAAVARARLEPKWEPVIDMELERAEIVNEAFDLVMRKLSVQVTPEPDPAQLLPPVDTLMSDYGPVGTDDITGDLLLDAFEENEAETAAIVQTLSALRLKHLSEQLNVERARLDREHQATGIANPRSVSIDRLLSLLTRRGEI